MVVQPPRHVAGRGDNYPDAAWRWGVTGQPVPETSRRRGRPPKPKPEPDDIVEHVGVGDPLTADQVQRLRTGLLGISGVAQLPPDQIEALIEQMVFRLPYSILAQRIVPQGIEGKRGPKPKLALPTLLVDCVKAWEAATGEQLRIWETVPVVDEALLCTMARVAIQVVLGSPGPYAHALHRPIKTAQGTLDHPWTLVS